MQNVAGSKPRTRNFFGSKKLLMIGSPIRFGETIPPAIPPRICLNALKYETPKGATNKCHLYVSSERFTPKSKMIAINKRLNARGLLYCIWIRAFATFAALIFVTKR